MKYKLSEVAYYSKEKIKTDELSPENYLSTENMLPEFGGITTASSLPTISTVTKYQPGDVLLSNIRPYFKKLYYSISEGGCSNDVLCLCAKDNIIKAFLYYSLKNDDFFKYVMATAKGTKMPRGDKSAIMDYELEVPDLETQQKIVRILSALDQKIELNNQQNKTIEKQAFALVQKYINNEKGTVKLKEIMSFDNGFAFKSKDYVDSGKYKVITIKNVQDGLIDSSSAQFVTDYPKDMRDYHKLSVGDVLLSLTGNVGRVGIVFEENLLLNQRVAKVKPKDENILPFLYFFFRQKDFKQKLEALAKGTAQLNLSPVETLNEKITYSEQPVLELSNRLKPFFEKIVLNNQNNKTLSSVRDLLLPKLMSGEVNLDKVTI